MVSNFGILLLVLIEFGVYSSSEVWKNVTTTEMETVGFLYKRRKFNLETNDDTYSDDVTSQIEIEFFKQLLERNPPLQLSTCPQGEENTVQVNISGSMPRIYVVKNGGNLQESISYHGGIFEQEQVYEAKSFHAIVWSHTPNESSSYLTFDAKLSGEIFIYAEWTGRLSYDTEIEYATVNQDSILFFNFDPSEGIKLTHTEYSDCEPLTNSTEIKNKLTISVAEMLVQDPALLSLTTKVQIINGTENYQIDLFTAEFKVVEISKSTQQGTVIFEVKDYRLNSTDDCLEQINPLTCQFYHIEYMLKYQDGSCVFRIEKAILLGEKVPCFFTLVVIFNNAYTLALFLPPVDYFSMYNLSTTTLATKPTTTIATTTSDFKTRRLQETRAPPFDVATLILFSLTDPLRIEAVKSRGCLGKMDLFCAFLILFSITFAI